MKTFAIMSLALLALTSCGSGNEGSSSVVSSNPVESSSAFEPTVAEGLSLLPGVMPFYSGIYDLVSEGDYDSFWWVDDYCGTWFISSKGDYEGFATQTSEREKAYLPELGQSFFAAYDLAVFTIPCSGSFLDENCHAARVESLSFKEGAISLGITYVIDGASYPARFGSTQDINGFTLYFGVSKSIANSATAVSWDLSNRADVEPDPYTGKTDYMQGTHKMTFEAGSRFASFNAQDK